MRGGGSRLIKNLPGGTKYAVQEADYTSDGYELTHSENAEGTISMEHPAVAVFTNTRNTYGSLRVSKSIEGDSAEADRYFKFTVTLDDTSINGRYGEMEFTRRQSHLRLEERAGLGGKGASERCRIHRGGVRLCGRRLYHKVRWRK